MPVGRDDVDRRRREQATAMAIGDGDRETVGRIVRRRQPLRRAAGENSRQRDRGRHLPPVEGVEPACRARPHRDDIALLLLLLRFRLGGCGLDGLPGIFDLGDRRDTRQEIVADARSRQVGDSAAQRHQARMFGGKLRIGGHAALDRQSGRGIELAIDKGVDHQLHVLRVLRQSILTRAILTRAIFMRAHGALQVPSSTGRGPAPAAEFALAISAASGLSASESGGGETSSRSARSPTATTLRGRFFAIHV